MVTSTHRMTDRPTDSANIVESSEVASVINFSPSAHRYSSNWNGAICLFEGWKIEGRDLQYIQHNNVQIK